METNSTLDRVLSALRVFSSRQSDRGTELYRAGEPIADREYRCTGNSNFWCAVGTLKLVSLFERKREREIVSRFCVRRQHSALIAFAKVIRLSQAAIRDFFVIVCTGRNVFFRLFDCLEKIDHAVFRHQTNSRTRTRHQAGVSVPTEREFHRSERTCSFA